MPSLIEVLKKEDATIDDILNAEKLSPKDIYELAHDYQEILDLEEKYKQATLGKKQIAEEIRKKIFFFNRFVSHLKGYMHSINQTYEYSQEIITDLEKAIRIILRLANQNTDSYSINSLKISGRRNFETIHGDKQSAELEGIVWIITNKEALKELDSNKIYPAHEISNITLNFLKKGYSLIIFTNYSYDSIVKPNLFNTDLTEEKISTHDLNSGISCYLQADELSNALNIFLNYISENGADIKDLDENELYQYLINKPKNESLIRKPN